MSRTTALHQRAHVPTVAELLQVSVAVRTRKDWASTALEDTKFIGSSRHSAQRPPLLLTSLLERPRQDYYSNVVSILSDPSTNRSMTVFLSA